VLLAKLVSYTYKVVGAYKLEVSYLRYDQNNSFRAVAGVKQLHVRKKSFLVVMCFRLRA